MRSPRDGGGVDKPLNRMRASILYIRTVQCFLNDRNKVYHTIVP